MSEPRDTWPVGARVVVRRRLPEGGYSDVLGELLANDESGVRVMTRTGEVHIPADVIAVGKRIPPPPPPRARRRPPPDDAAASDG